MRERAAGSADRSSAPKPRPPPPTADARRHRTARARRRAGMACLRVEASEFELIEALIRADYLSPDDGLRRSAVERAAAEVLADFIKRWVK